MFSSVSRKLLFVLGALFFFSSSFAQQVKMELRREPTTNKQNLIDLVVALDNIEEQLFDGYIKIKTPEGFRSISGEQIQVHLDAQSKTFVPIKILFQNIAQAGNSSVEVSLLDRDLKVLQTEYFTQKIEENNNLRLSTDYPMVFINNPNDSIAVQVTVGNFGNRKQDATVVFSIPGLVGEKNFFERKGVVAIQKDTTFVFKFLPSPRLLEQPQFTINVAGMRGVEKVMFGNLSIKVQNVSSTKHYQERNSSSHLQYHQKNSLTVSYRNIGDNNKVYQMTGSGDINLAAGYLSLSGNVYKANYTDELMVNNTYLSYHLDNHEIKIGNINQSLEMSLFGRGVEVGTTNASKSNKFQIGFIEQNYNLIEQHGFLKNGYGLYASGVLGESNATNQTSVSYVFKDDNLERVKHHLAGIDRVYVYNKDWRGSLKGHVAMSSYEATGINEPSFALETQYNGEVKEIKLLGNYFFSTGYFPGNRRGILQFQQNANKTISKNRVIYANVFGANFSPKSHSYGMNMSSANFRFDSGISFARVKNIALKLGYQYQTESSDTPVGITGTPAVSLGLKTHRLVESLNWMSKNNKHAISLTLEEGLTKLLNESEVKTQFRANTIYGFKRLRVNFMYQYGGFYLSEYTLASRRGDENQAFQRITSSIAFDDSFMDKKIALTSGVAYIKDFTTGQIPSAFLNVKYMPNEQYHVYLNSSWYRYDSNSINLYAQSSNSVFVIEAGVIFNFRKRTPSSKRKSNMVARVYYDKNTNNIFDGDDEIAPDYLITINNTTFKTNQEGKLLYRSLPFGSYKLKPSVQKGWFTTGGEHLVSNYKTAIDIPLHQSGTASGKVRYDVDMKKALDFNPIIGGVVFNITEGDRFIQRISTNDEGAFLLFLPTGQYQITLDKSSLPKNAYCEESVRDFAVQAGKITSIEKFIIKIREKKVNIKKFGI